MWNCDEPYEDEDDGYYDDGLPTDCHGVGSCGICDECLAAYWDTKDGSRLAIESMSDQHLCNANRMLERISASSPSAIFGITKLRARNIRRELRKRGLLPPVKTELVTFAVHRGERLDNLNSAVGGVVYCATGGGCYLTEEQVSSLTVQGVREMSRKGSFFRAVKSRAFAVINEEVAIEEE